MKFLIAFLLFGFVVLPVMAAPSELEKINAQIAQTQRQNQQLEQRVRSSMRAVDATKKKLVDTADQVSNLEEQRDIMTRKIAELDAQQAQLIQIMARDKKHIADAAAGILFIASNPSFDSADMHNYVLTSAILSGAADQFNDEIARADAQIKQLNDIRQKRTAEKKKLDKTAQKYADEKNQLDKLLRTRAAQNEELRNQQAALQKKLRDMSARAKSISELSAGVGNSQMSGDARLSRRKLNQPVRGRIVVHFGEKSALGLKSDGWRISTRGDALVMAPADGVVKFADAFRGFGRVVIISHKNGFNTVMTNLGDVNVMVGQDVLAGEPVGRMSSDKNEMYLEVRRGATVIDPAKLFKEDN
ncbi:MAG: peptidoglycan DD-metalloendopeptidase family protein [Alphaproteobacteria bacterium]|nr:peptidoglycan DD-metalloendopeptidase family protein [Alphaproteobacteria bacterium]